MSKKAVIATGAVALLVGVGIGSAGHSAPTHTVHRTIVKTVAGPVRTKTVVHTRSVVPGSCLSALSDSTTMDQAVSKFSRAAEGYPPLIAKAYKAGVLGADVSGIVSKIRTANSGLADAVALAGPAAQSFKSHAAACRAAAKSTS